MFFDLTYYEKEKKDIESQWKKTNIKNSSGRDMNDSNYLQTT